MVSPRPARRRLLVAADLTAGIVVLLFTVVSGLVALGQLTGYGVLGETCREAGCDTAPLTTIIVVAAGAVVFAAALALGFFLVRAISGRWAWFVPVIGLVVIIAIFWIATAAVGAWAAGVNSA